MKILFSALACAFLAGCDFSTPLPESSARNIDRGILGAWQHVDERGTTNRAVLLPMGTREYLVVVMPDQPESGFGRARLCAVGDQTLIQVEWIGTSRGQLPGPRDPVFQFAAYTATGWELKIRPLNPERVSPDAATPEDLARAIEEHAGAPDLFREEVVLRREWD